MQDDGLTVLQVGRHFQRNIGVRRGGHHHHHHLRAVHRLAHIRGDQAQLAKAARAAFVRFKLDPAAALNGVDVAESAIAEGHVGAHEGQVGSHGFAAIAGADDGVTGCFDGHGVTPLLQKVLRCAALPAAAARPRPPPGKRRR